VHRLTFFHAAAIAVVLVGTTAGSASAQIYSWHDDSGRLVLSNRRPSGGEGVTSYKVPKSDDVVATRRAAPAVARADYDDIIVEHARRNSVRPSLVRAVIQVESGFNPGARSPKGAMGLMQLMPATAREFGVRNAYNPEENVGAGVRYLRQLLDRYDGDEKLALAAYNAGPGAVDKYGETVPPYQETRQYVKKVDQLAGTTRVSGVPKLYSVIEIVDGRPVIKFTDKKPE
jgi:hypothetical protein